MFPWFYTINYIDHLLRSQNSPIWCCDRWKSNDQQQRRRDQFERELWSAQSFHHVIFFYFCRCNKHHNPSNWLCRQSSISPTGWNDLYKERNWLNSASVLSVLLKKSKTFSVFLCLGEGKIRFFAKTGNAWKNHLVPQNKILINSTRTIIPPRYMN